MKKRLLFTYGSLFEPKVITALLGEEPKGFLGTLHGYVTMKGISKVLPNEVKKIIAEELDIQT